MAEALPTEPLPLRVTAVLVVYNQAQALRRAVQALLASQGKEQIEVLVVDCASQDASAQIDREFPGIQVLRLPHHLGAARAMNIAVRTAKAESVFFLSPNLEVASATVLALADQLDNETAWAAVAPLLVDTEGRPVPQLRQLPAAGSLGDDLPAKPADTGSPTVALEFPSFDALLIRKNFVRGMNYFDERFGHTWADADLAMQMKRSGKKAVICTAIRASWHPAPDPLAGDKLLRADRVNGAAAFLGKYAGGGAETLFRIKSALSALARFDFTVLSGVLSGTKLDGSQAH